MKKILLGSLLCICLLVGCSTQSGSTKLEATTTDTIPQVTEVTKTVTVADYSITGMQNVTDLYFASLVDQGWGKTYSETAAEKATCIIVHVMCPQCNEKTFDLIEFAELPEASIGQQMFTWIDSLNCDNWTNHEDSFDSEYNYSILFTLNG